MAEPDGQSVDWRTVARAVPGGVGIQRGERLVYVSPAFAAAVGRDRADLADGSWRRLFDSEEARRVEDGLATARADGRWSGGVSMVGAGRAPVDLTLSVPEGDDIVVWSVSDRTVGSPDGAGDERADSPQGTSARLARTVLQTVEDVAYVIGEDGNLLFWNEYLAETTGYSHEEIAEMDAMEFIPPDQHEYVPGLMEAIDSIDDRVVEVDILTSDGERVPHEFSGTTFEDPVTGRSFRCGVARNISERLERERDIERQRDELARLNRINEFLFETARESVQTGRRDTVTRVVCERVATSEFYRFAWLGQSERGTKRVVHEAAHGLDGDPAPLRVGGPDDDPVRRAIETGTVVVEPCTAETTRQWCEVAGETESVSAVPLQHGGTVYGVLVVGATQPDAFTPRERTGFEVLGRLVGVVVHADRTRKLLFADAVVELEFDATGVGSFFVDVAATLECTISLDGYVPGSAGWVLYLSVEGAAPRDVISILADEPRVDRVRPVADGEQSGRVEVVVEASPLLSGVTAAGASVQTATAGPDDARIVVEAPADGDIDRVADHIRGEFPQATLIATRELDRAVTTNGAPGGVLERLTTRQREVLEAAYRAGYFDWPRESTGEEVAEALGLTSATVQGHLRKAERAVFAALLAEE
jgi:PAS domain S-box-containing protein